MTLQNDTKKALDNPEFLKGIIQTALQEFLEQEMKHHIGALPYERNEKRKDYRNGYKSRTVKTRIGAIELALPQSRKQTFQSGLFTGYQRSEKAFISCLQEMVIQGVSTRKVSKITEELCGVQFSSSQVSEICKTLDDEVKRWLNRPLPLEYPYVYVDAVYEKIRENHRIESHGVLIAAGVSETGHREILSVAVANTENESNWGDFFFRLKERGLSDVKLVISDAHKGLKSAIVQHFQGCQWQRCQVHFKKNVMDKVRAKDKGWIKEQLNDIFGAPDKPTAIERIKGLVVETEQKYPALAELIENETEDAIACLNFPASHRKRIRTTNGLERLNEEIRRRTRVIRIFPNRSSALRMISSLCMEWSEEWMTGKKYLTMENLEKDEVIENQITTMALVL